MISRRSTSYAAALVALVALAGCATDNTLSAVSTTLDSAPPSAPTNIRGEERGNVAVLAWDASPEADVIGYDVYVYSPDPARESAYVRLNASPISAEEYSVTDNANLNAWYRVKAVDLSGNRSSGSGAAFVAGTIAVGGTESTEEPSIRR